MTLIIPMWLLLKCTNMCADKIKKRSRIKMRKTDISFKNNRLYVTYKTVYTDINPVSSKTFL